MAALLWLFAHRNIRHVDVLGDIAQICPGGPGFAVLVQTRLQHHIVTGLLKKSVEHTTAKFGREKVSQPRLKRHIYRETPILRGILATNIERRLGQMLCGSLSIIFDLLGNFDRTIFCSRFASQQFISKVVDSGKKLWVERTNITEDAR